MSAVRHPTSRPIPAQSGARELLDADQAAARLGTPVRFVRRLVAQRRIRFYKVGRYVRFDVRDLDAFVDEGMVEPFREGVATSNRR